MGIFGRTGSEAGTVVIARYPFSDLSRAIRRPAVVIAQSSPEDWILCPITTNPYTDNRAIQLNADSLATGALWHNSYVRPNKLFTAKNTLITGEIGTLLPDVFNHLLDTITSLLEQSRK